MRQQIIEMCNSVAWVRSCHASLDWLFKSNLGRKTANLIAYDRCLIELYSEYDK